MQRHHVQHLSRLVSIRKLQSARDSAHLVSMFLNNIHKKGKGYSGQGIQGSGFFDVMKSVLVDNNPIHILETKINKVKRDALSKLFGHIKAGKRGSGIIEGSGFFSSIGHFFKKTIPASAKKAGHVLKRFVDGKTKVKPSMILKAVAEISKIGSAIASATGRKGVAKGLAGVSNVSDKVSDVAKKHGRGVSIAGMGLKLAGQGYGSRGGRIIGTKKEVWKGTAMKTSGGLTKNDLMLNKVGRVVSKKKHQQGKKMYQNIKKYSFRKK